MPAIVLRYTVRSNSTFMTTSISEIILEGGEGGEGKGGGRGLIPSPRAGSLKLD